MNYRTLIPYIFFGSILFLGSTLLEDRPIKEHTSIQEFDCDTMDYLYLSYDLHLLKDVKELKIIVHDMSSATSFRRARARKRDRKVKKIKR